MRRVACIPAALCRRILRFGMEYVRRAQLRRTAGVRGQQVGHAGLPVLADGAPTAPDWLGVALCLHVRLRTYHRRLAVHGALFFYPARAAHVCANDVLLACMPRYLQHAWVHHLGCQPGSAR